MRVLVLPCLVDGQEIVGPGVIYVGPSAKKALHSSVELRQLSDALRSRASKDQKKAIRP